MCTGVCLVFGVMICRGLTVYQISDKKYAVCKEILEINRRRKGRRKTKKEEEKKG